MHALDRQFEVKIEMLVVNGPRSALLTQNSKCSRDEEMV